MPSSTPSESSGRVDLFPFTEQEPFLGTDHRYYGYISGVGAGKTHAGLLRTAYNMEQWNPGEMGAIVAPTTTMVKDVIIPLMREVGLLDRWDYKSMHTEEPGIHAPNGSRALILSADNRKTIERLAGLNLAWWWLDEASRVDARAQEILTQRLRVGRYQNGYVTTTPMGRDHIYDFYYDETDGTDWTHGEADVHEHGRGDRLAILRVPTWANPFTGEAYKADMESKEGQVYEREILGKFVQFEGLVYPWFTPETHVVSRDDIGNVRRMIYGVDWGLRNPFAIVAIGYTTRDRYVVFDEVYNRGLNYAEMVDVAAALQDHHGPGRWFCDPSEPAAIDMFQEAGLDAEKGENSVMPGIQYVSGLRDQLRVVADCQNLRNEFEAYHYPDDDDAENPVEANDHLLDALRYALVTDQGGPGTGLIGSDPRYL